MRNKLWNKKIPTLLGLLLIVLGTGLTSYLVSRGVIFVSKAGPSQVPQEVRVSNISDNSFTVTYTTEDNVFGSVNYGDSQSLENTALDDRDQLTRSVENHRIHSITVKNLNPSTKYFFSINSAQNKYLNKDAPFQVTTGGKINADPSNQKPIIGKIITASGTAPQETLILLSSGESQVASVLSKEDGSFILPLNSLRDKNLSSYYIFPESSSIKLLILGEGQKSNVTVSIEQTNPVPTITIGNNYDFTSSLTPVASSSATSSNSSFPSFDTGESLTTDPTITSPTKDEGLSDQQPIFKGKALPDQNVKIEIHSESPITTQITSDANGNWQYRPTSPLSPGEHTISVTTKGANGILKTITQSFTVYASGTKLPGSQVTPTPSASPSNSTPTPTANPTPMPSPTLTPLPVASITPTPTPFTEVVETPPASASSSPTPVKSTLPPTGTSTIFLAVIGIIVAMLGFAILLALKKGKVF